MRGRIDGISQNALRGWAWDPSRPHERLTVRFRIDGQAFDVVVANLSRRDLKAAGIGDGAHGIRWSLPPALTAGGTREVVLEAVNSDGEISTLDCRAVSFDTFGGSLDGRIEGFRGGRCFGWAWDSLKPTQRVTVRAHWNGDIVAVATADLPRGDLKAAGIGDGAHAFRLEFPPSIWKAAGAEDTIKIDAADGRPIGIIKLPANNLVATLVERGRKAERRGDMRAAITALDEAIKLELDSVDALWVRARIAANQGEPEVARRLAQRVLDLSPGHPRAATVLGRLAYADGQYEKAFQLWLMIKPGDTAYRESLIKAGRSLLRLGRPVEVLKFGHAALDLNAGDADAHRLLADAYLSLGHGGGAEPHVKVLAAAQPEDRKLAQQLLRLPRFAPSPPEATAPLEIFEDATLRTWTGQANGTTSGTVEPVRGVILRPRSRKGKVEYSVVEPQEFQAGELPHYGLRLAAHGSSAELACRIRPNAAELLHMGIRYYFEARATGRRSAKLTLNLVFAGPSGPICRKLTSCTLTSRAQLRSVDLALDKGLSVWPAQGEAWLVMVLGAGSSAVLRIPRPLCLLPHTRGEVKGQEGPPLDPALFAVSGELSA